MFKLKESPETVGVLVEGISGWSDSWPFQLSPLELAHLLKCRITTNQPSDEGKYLIQKGYIDQID